jgi:hypothetical protein
MLLKKYIIDNINILVIFYFFIFRKNLIILWPLLAHWATFSYLGGKIVQPTVGDVWCDQQKWEGSLNRGAWIAILRYHILHNAY